MSLPFPPPFIGDPDLRQPIETLWKATKDIETRISTLSGGGGFSVVDAKGDLIAGTADNTVDNLTVGANDTILMADSAQSTGLKWVASATTSTISGTNTEGTADNYARSDHNHALPNYGTIYFPPCVGALTSGSPTANQMYYSMVTVLSKSTLTGVEFRPTNSTGSVKAALYDSAGNQVAVTTSGAALTGSGFGTKQQVAFSSTYAANPGVYYCALAFNNAASTYGKVDNTVRGGSVGSSYTTPVSSITVPSDAIGTNPYMWTY